jgi:hypothetical protein
MDQLKSARAASAVNRHEAAFTRGNKELSALVLFADESYRCTFVFDNIQPSDNGIAK